MQEYSNVLIRGGRVKDLPEFNTFKSSSVKSFDVKLKYWLDDFYTGGKDTLCQDSLTLTRCSMNYKLQTTNFF